MNSSAELWFEQRYLRAFMKDAIDENRSGIHVTDLTHPCPRHIYYKLLMRKKDPSWEKRIITPDKANIFWIGSRYHEIPMSNVIVKPGGGIVVLNDLNGYDIRIRDDDGAFVVYDRNGMEVGVWGHEFPVRDPELNVVGRIDELMFYDGELYVLDKKTARYIPNEPYDNYKNQVRIYASILHKFHDLHPTKGAILYIKKDNLQLRSFVFELGDLDAQYAWFAERAKMIFEAVDRMEVPEKVENKLCKWCEFKALCEADANDVPLNWKIARGRQTRLTF